jgi:preprotein translocase subunit SecE
LLSRNIQTKARHPHIRVLFFPDFPAAGLCCGHVRIIGLAMAKFNPSKFIREVRTETARVTWPSGRETAMTTVMVMIMTAMLGIFFFGVDSFFSWVVKALLSLI